MTRNLALAGLLLVVLFTATGATVAAVPPGCAGQFKIDNSTKTYVVEAINSGSPFGITLGGNGRQVSMDVPPQTSYLGHVPGNQWVSFFAWRGDTGDIGLGAAELSSCDLGGDLQILVTEKAGKPVYKVLAKPSGWFTFPTQLQ